MDGCRTCVRNPTTGDSGHDLFAAEQRTALRLLTAANPDIAVNVGDALPTRICHECRAQLSSFEKFCTQAVEADRHYRKLSSGDDVKSEKNDSSELNPYHFLDVKVKPEDASGDDLDDGDHDDPTDDNCFHDRTSRSALDESHDSDDDSNSDTPIMPSKTKMPASQIVRTKTNHKTATKRRGRQRYASDSDSDWSAPDEKPATKRRSHKKRPPNSDEADSASAAADRKQPAARAKRRPTFECDTCSRRFLKKHRLAAHMRTLHLGAAKPYACEHCSKEFTAHKTLVVHLHSRHGPDQPTACPHEGCGKTFRQPHLMRDHLERIHLKPRPKRQRIEYVCDECGQLCATINSLTEHKKLHVALESFQWHCQVCDKRFRHKGNYEIHTLRHENVRNYPCPVCPSRMVTKGEFKVHMRRHAREKVRCPDCPEEFTSKVLLQQHVLIAHQGHQAFSCRFCSRQFTRIMSMRYHERTHTGEKPCACPECPERFPNPGMLNAHIKRAHEQNR